MGTSRRDYEIIAKCLRTAREALLKVTSNKKAEVIVEQSFDVLILLLADEFEATYTNFNRRLFLRAVYVHDVEKYERMLTSHVELP